MRKLISGKVTLEDAGRFICIDTGRDVYEIETSRIDSPEKLIHWLHHLSQKTWFTPHICRDLIVVACDHMGIAPWGVIV